MKKRVSGIFCVAGILSIPLWAAGLGGSGEPGSGGPGGGGTAILSAALRKDKAQEGGAGPSRLAGITLLRSGSFAETLTVSISLGGSAVNGVDYAEIPLTIQFPADQPALTIVVAALDDELVEGPETVQLTILPGAGYAVGTPASTQTTILDDDSGTGGGGTGGGTGGGGAGGVGGNGSEGDGAGTGAAPGR